MIKEAFGKGATNEEAIEAAKAELNAPWDADVQVELIKMANLINGMRWMKKANPMAAILTLNRVNR